MITTTYTYIQPMRDYINKIITQNWKEKLFQQENLKYLHLYNILIAWINYKIFYYTKNSYKGKSVKKKKTIPLYIIFEFNIIYTEKNQYEKWTEVGIRIFQ